MHFPKVIIIELHAPTSSTQKLKLIGKGEQFTYTPTIILGQSQWRGPSHSYQDFNLKNCARAEGHGDDDPPLSS
jgi:hypothetical protein